MKRNLYLKTISVEEAQLKFFNFLNDNNILIKETENIEVFNSLNRITSEAVYSKCNSPLFTAAAMDGICVNSKITKNASEEHPILLKLGKDYKIVDTGDAITLPYDAVIMAEDVIEIDEETVKIISPVSGWENVRPIGEDIVANEMILETNHIIKPIDIGAMIAGGIININVYKKIKVGIIPTGDEIINPKDNPSIGDIIDSNSYMVKSLVEETGNIATRYDIVKDDYEQIKKVIQQSINDNDITITLAGSSAGTEDYSVNVMEELGQVLVHGISTKPGKPVILSVINNKPVIGLPGYPLSAYLNFDLFVRPLLSIVNSQNKKYIDAFVSKRIISSLKHREYIRVKIGKVDNKYIATPLHRGAASQMSMVKADGILVVPQNSEGIETGEIVKVELLKNEDVLNNTLLSIGSHDILMDIVADIFAKNYHNIVLSSTHVGSLGGLMALKRGETIIAPTHLLDEKTGIYNIDIIKEIFGSGKVSLIKGFDRIQGIMVKKGNPLNIKSLSDLTKYKFVNRQRGAGTRVLFDYKLKQLNINPLDIDGYDKEVSTHMAVAAAVKNGDADCGLGVKSAANSMDLDFIEVGIEEYDFAIMTKNLNDEKIQKFIEIIKSEQLKNKLDELTGYGYSNVGKIINI